MVRWQATKGLYRGDTRPARHQRLPRNGGKDRGVNVDAEPTVELVRQLLDEQFPQWADLDITEVSSQGWDNRTFRLGSQMSVRLPSGDGYAPQVDREQRWLPFLSQRLHTPIPSPVAKGLPSRAFPRVWSVYRWLDGVPLDETETVDLGVIAADVAAFLCSLQALPTPPGAPTPEQSNGFRGDPFDRYLAEGEAAVPMLGRPLRQQARKWLQEATESSWSAAPVWVHGDMAAGNLLTREDRLGAVIDFGCMAVGDPACDLTVAWTTFDARSREVFRHHVGQDPETWRRARGWAVWKAAITLKSAPEDSAKHQGAQRAIRELWGDDA
jgi:aminoglycoside phosphotransferase (APT) family kinase protein